MLTPYFEVSGLNFHDSWIALLDNIVEEGRDIVFGSLKEKKYARDTTQLIILEEEAIKQIEKKDIHPGYGLKERAMQSYVDEFDRDWYEDYKKLPQESMKRFTYLYIERLIDTYADQFEFLRKSLAKSIESGISSNRDLAIIWNPVIDMDNESPPCFQQVWIRYYDPGDIDMRLVWRSRDAFDAWPGNEVGIVLAMNKEVFSPNNCRIKRLIDYNYSLHVYRGRLQQASDVVKKDKMQKRRI
jgi:thymidylate synthase